MLTPHVLLVPSTPTLLIDERREGPSEMIDAFVTLASILEADAPATLVVVTSRWIGRGLFHVDDAKAHRSVIDLPGFGVEPRYDCAGDPALGRAILEAARHAGIRAVAARRGADTGVSVPLHFLATARRWPVVPVSISDASPEAHRAWGGILRRAIAAWPAPVAVLVSGPLTFSEHEFSLRRESLEDRDLDTLAMDAIRAGDWDAIAGRAARFPAKAHPEAGWRHLMVLRGLLEGGTPGTIAGYEPLPGIGSLLARFDAPAPGPADPAPPAAD